jgi:hypothetical protein
MPTSKVWVLAGFCTVATVVAQGPAVAATAAPAIELVEPQPGTPLVGGTRMSLAWQSRGSSVPPGDEWEAFLSLDGGSSYTIRITPHLDRDRRTASWTVPEVPSQNVRFLFRFGDEQRETAVELPATYTIVASNSPASAIARVNQRGEPARPHEAGVAVWEEGPRSGAWSRRVMAFEINLRQGLAHEALGGQLAPEGLTPSPWPRFEARSTGVIDPPSTALLGATTTAPSAWSVDRLLQTARRNE